MTTDAGQPAEGSNRTPALWPFYVGGFLGPFGGAMVNAILPEIGAGVGTDEAGAATALTAYMIPFSVLMIASGTLGARWGLTRTIRVAYGLYAAASVLCMVASSLPVFLGGRALQGVANAFTTPLLVALIATLVPPERLARALGAYASFQAAGQAFAPFIGGLAAEWTYKAAFGASALAAIALAVLTRGTDGGERTPADWRALRNWRLVRSAGTAFCNQFASSAVMVLAALVAADRFGLSASARGLVVACFGLAGLFTGRYIGGLAERYGVVRVGAVALVLGGAAVAAVGIAPWVAALVALVAAAGVAGTAGRVLTNSMAVASTPGNIGGATSITMATQFVGTAIVPALLPLYAASPVAACAVAGALSAVGALVATARRA